MGGTIKAAHITAAGLRALRSQDREIFAGWESNERPYPWSAASFPNDTLVLEDDRGLVGFAVLRVVQDEAHLTNVMVNPARRRSGLGVKLLQKVMMSASLAGARFVVLDVDPANTPAVQLYRKLGFQQLERRKKSYPRGEDALIMRKKLCNVE